MSDAGRHTVELEAWLRQMDGADDIWVIDNVLLTGSTNASLDVTLFEDSFEQSDLSGLWVEDAQNDIFLVRHWSILAIQSVTHRTHQTVEVVLPNTI